ncbi:hypothetical protein D1007_31940 [Hordeum vulgare]|nr:hypothetical protein D1007_31940 [Hordeum vulgare]
MSKRRRSADEEGGPPRHYLYFVVDDWTDGYSIYKVDVADFDGDPSADLDSQTRRLPGPPVFRLECSHSRCRHPRFAALGSRIIAMDYRENKATTRVLMFDTATGGVAVGPCVPAELQRLYRFVPAGDSLYVVGTLTSDDPAYFRFGVLAADAGKGRRWAWNAGLGGPCNMWQVVCTAAHPDGRTIFFSMYYAITYSFDTETREWKHQGDWKLPFQGHACYDGELDAWVGLRRGPTSSSRGPCAAATWCLRAAVTDNDRRRRGRPSRRRLCVRTGVGPWVPRLRVSGAGRGRRIAPISIPVTDRKRGKERGAARAARRAQPLRQRLASSPTRGARGRASLLIYHR